MAIFSREIWRERTEVQPSSRGKKVCWSSGLWDYRTTSWRDSSMHWLDLQQTAMQWSHALWYEISGRCSITDEERGNENDDLLCPRVGICEDFRGGAEKSQTSWAAVTVSVDHHCASPSLIISCYPSQMYLSAEIPQRVPSGHEIVAHLDANGNLEEYDAEVWAKRVELLFVALEMCRSSLMMTILWENIAQTG